jgi:DNA-binding transcriptional regulator YhcF (GntR family)
MKNYLKIINFDDHSIVPKYLQIYNGIIDGINSHQLNRNDLLPSINDLSEALDIARNTVERSYKDLKSIGVIDSVAGKGYYISKSELGQNLKILILFNELSCQKKMMFDSLTQSIGSLSLMDLFVYNNDYSLFRRVLEAKKDYYNKIVIVPHFNKDEKKALQLIDLLPKEKLVLMDKLPDGIRGRFGAVYQDFEKNIFYALTECAPLFSNYGKLKLIFPLFINYAQEIISGFTKFCKSNNISFEIIPDLDDEQIQAGTAYLTIDDTDLVKLIEQAEAKGLKIGQEIGVISYNESPMKKILQNGITTISTDFELMGHQVAAMLLKNNNSLLRISYKINIRNSL